MVYPCTGYAVNGVYPPGPDTHSEEVCMLWSIIDEDMNKYSTCVIIDLHLSGMEDVHWANLGLSNPSHFIVHWCSGKYYYSAYIAFLLSQ